MRQIIVHSTLFAFVIAMAFAATAGSQGYESEYERSGGALVGNAIQAVELEKSFSNSKTVTAHVIGVTAEQRSIIAFEVGPHEQPPIILFGGIHAGEVEGSIALLHLVRDIGEGKFRSPAHAFIIPFISPDGSVDLGVFNRPNQKGPGKSGFRVNASYLNLNRDFLKVESPEIRALLKLVSEVRPALVADFHTTDGGVFNIDVGVQVLDTQWGRTDRPCPDIKSPALHAATLSKARKDLVHSLLTTLTKKSIRPTDFYPQFRDDTSPRDGFEEGSPKVQYSDSYFAARGIIGVLVEVNAYRNLRERVRIASETALGLLAEASTKATIWKDAVRATEDEIKAYAPGSKDIELSWKNKEGEKREITFIGLNPRYSKITDAMENVYEGAQESKESLPFAYKVPEICADAPAKDGGYVVAGGFTPVIEPILKAHGIHYEPLKAQYSFHEPSWFKVKKATFDNPDWAPSRLFSEPSREGRSKVKIDGHWDRNPSYDVLGRFASGSLFIPIAQPQALLIVALLEPLGPDSFLSWGLANAIWERHEYIERHRAVLLAEAAVDKCPHLRDIDPTGENNLEFILLKVYPELRRRIGWVPVLKVNGLPKVIAHEEAKVNPPSDNADESKCRQRD